MNIKKNMVWQLSRLFSYSRSHLFSGYPGFSLTAGLTCLVVLLKPL